MRYIGVTSDFEKRLKEHNSGNTISTRGRGPWEKLYCEEGYDTKHEALLRENKLKKMKGGESFKALLKNAGVVHR